ncbi:MAG: hypothetical protein Q9201_007267 [Fulgogasparrea decipioides]
MPGQQSAMAVPISQRSLRPLPKAQTQVRQIYILVMGLTGAGKSTFISVVTEDDAIPIGEPGELDSVTDSVADYIVNIRQPGITYEVHLIDSPGFDDGTATDAIVLNRIAAFINTHYMLGNTLAGVLYLHDITKAKMGGAGLRNLRMLEQMVGDDKWDNCTLVTTKWGCTTDFSAEEAREKRLMDKDQYFGAMLKGEDKRQASMMRFDPKSRGKALEIIKPHLKRKFEPLISWQMVDPQGPMLSLGETSAGGIVADYLEEWKKATGEIEEFKESNKILARKFDMMLFENFKAKRDKLLREQKLHKAGRWATRTALVGGAIAATVVTFGPGASAFALEPAFETYAGKQRHDDRAKMDKLEKEFQKENEARFSDTGGYRSEWLRDRNVQSISDLSDNYSIRSSSSTDLSTVDAVRMATDLAGFSIKDTSIP